MEKETSRKFREEQLFLPMDGKKSSIEMQRRRLGGE